MLTVNDFKIDDPIVLVSGHKRGRKGIVVEIPYEEADNGNTFLGVLWDDNPSIGIQPVLPHMVELRD